MRHLVFVAPLLAIALACGGGEPGAVIEPPAALSVEAPPPSADGPVVGSVAWFETSGSTCQWQVREMQSREGDATEVVVTRTLGVLDAPCTDDYLQFFLNPGADRAVVWWGYQADGAAWSVDLSTGLAARLPALPMQSSYALSADGSILGFSVDSTESMAEAFANTFHFEGREYPSDVQDGLPALAVAWKLDGDAWKSIEVATTSTGWDYAADEQNLTAYEQAAGVRSIDLIKGFVGDAPMETADEALAATLAGLAPIDPEMAEGGEWQVATQDGKSLAWFAFSAEFLVPTAPVYWNLGEGWQPLPGLTHKTGDNLSFAWKGPIVTVSQSGMKPSFWSSRTGMPIADAPQGLTATSWPHTR